MANIEKPKIFISYCWTNDDYIKKVVDFSQRLISDGIDVMLDQFEMKYGNDINNYMEKCVADPSITNVLILLSPDYKTKADTRSGGAGKETQIISGEVYNNIGNTKFIPVLFEKRGEDVDACIPVYLKQRRYIDMSENSDFESRYIELVKILYGNEKYVKNPLGSKPDWVEETNNQSANSQIIVNTFKFMKKEYNDMRAVAYSFDYILNSLKEVREKFANIKECGFDGFEKYYSYFDEIRNPYFAFINEIKFDYQFNESIYSFFSDFKKLITNSKKDYKLFLIVASVFIHELFIDTIAMLLKCRNYKAINNLTFTPYVDNLDVRGVLDHFSDTFYSLYKNEVFNLDNYLGRELHPNKEHGGFFYSGIAELWTRKIPIKYINKYDFANADCLLTNIAISSKKYWFALSYGYLPNGNSEVVNEIALFLKSRKLANKVYFLFDCSDKDKMKEILRIIKEYSDKYELKLSYRGTYNPIPLISDFIKNDDIESEN